MEVINPVIKNQLKEGIENPDFFWDRAARELPWLKTWDQVFQYDYPTFNWFIGAKTNLSYMCIDHHVNQGRGGHTAFIYANELGEREQITYAQLKRAVEKAAAGLRGLGIGKGDRLTVYMPNSLETVILMLATVRIGAIHSVVFAGFGAPALADRIKASGSKAVFSADIAYRKGSEVQLKSIVDDAIDLGCDSVEHQVVLKRHPETPMRTGLSLIHI